MGPVRGGSRAASACLAAATLPAPRAASPGLLRAYVRARAAPVLHVRK
jgi:hypothetical protein